MQDVVLEVLEGVIGILRAFQVKLDMFQEKARPIFAIVTRHRVERIKRQLMMGAIGVRGIDNAKK